MAAAALTLAVTISLTIYALTTKSDFTMMGGALWILAFVLLICSIISIFNPSMILQLVICGLVVIVYGFYLIYDVQLIAGGKVILELIILFLVTWIINWWLHYSSPPHLHWYNNLIFEDTPNITYYIWKEMRIVRFI